MQLTFLEVEPEKDKHKSPEWFAKMIQERRKFWKMQYEKILDKWACYEYHGYFP